MILVDFRGYDTFGEITVLGIAAVGVLALLDGLRVRKPQADAQGRAWSFDRQPLMLRVAARLVLPLALVVSVYIFWRGHNLPGGGFIAGLVTAVALVLQYMALGQDRAEALLHAGGGRRYTRWIGSGLGIAGAHRRRRLRVRPALPDQRLRPPGGAGAGRAAAGHGGAVRPGRLRHRGRRDDADAVGAGRGQQGARGMTISMELLVASGIGWVTACGIYLLLRGRTFPVVLGLTLLGYAVNVFIFAMGRLWTQRRAHRRPGATAVADPLPQALVLTAIVIGFATTGFVIELALRSRHENGSDHVDGRLEGQAEGREPRG